MMTRPQRLQRLGLAVGLALLALTSGAHAEAEPRVVSVPAGSFFVVQGVNVRNGNFAVTFATSANTESPSAVALHRVYNSKSTEQLGFGIGWGSRLANKVHFDIYSDLEIIESGTGSTTTYTMKRGSPGQEYMSNNSITKRFMTDAENNATRSKENLARAFVKSGQLTAMPTFEYKSLGPIPDGSVFEIEGGFKGNACTEGSEIRRNGERMRRVFGPKCGIEAEVYTLDGTLVNIVTRDGTTTREVTVERDPGTKLVTSVTDWDGKTTNFKYDARGRLIRQDNPNGSNQRFEYDDRDNMTAIVYLDDRRTTMTYDSEDRVVATTRRLGPTATFEYMKDPYNPKIDLTRVTQSQGDEKAVTVFKLLNE